MQQLPIVFQANKRDLTDITTIDELRSAFRSPACAHVESIAMRDVGTVAAIDALLELRMCSGEGSEG